MLQMENIIHHVINTIHLYEYYIGTFSSIDMHALNRVFLSTIFSGNQKRLNQIWSATIVSDNI